MTLATGSRLGPYEVIAAIGAGGMGEVYRARDSRLGRDVAIKILPPQFAAQPYRLRRFEEEARAIAGLNHPHICQIYDVGPGYLVLEYIEGTPPRGPYAPDEAVRLGLQIVSALDAAHQRRIASNYPAECAGRFRRYPNRFGRGIKSRHGGERRLD